MPARKSDGSATTEHYDKPALVLSYILYVYRRLYTPKLDSGKFRASTSRLLLVENSAAFFTGRSPRNWMPSVAAALGYRSDERDFLGRWLIGCVVPDKAYKYFMSVSRKTGHRRLRLSWPCRVKPHHCHTVRCTDRVDMQDLDSICRDCKRRLKAVRGQQAGPGSSSKSASSSIERVGESGWVGCAVKLLREVCVLRKLGSGADMFTFGTSWELTCANMWQAVLSLSDM